MGFGYVFVLVLFFFVFPNTKFPFEQFRVKCNLSKTCPIIKWTKEKISFFFKFFGSAFNAFCPLHLKFHRYVPIKMMYIPNIPVAVRIWRWRWDNRFVSPPFCRAVCRFSISISLDRNKRANFYLRNWKQLLWK